MKQVVRAVAAAAVLLAGLSSAHAALVTYRVNGFVTQSWTFDDGTTVPEATPVKLTYTYDTSQAAASMHREEDGSGTAVYKIEKPYHFKLHVGAHRARSQSYTAELHNNQGQPFADTYELQSIGAYIDRTWQPNARIVLQLLSQFDSTDALHSLRLPKHLNPWSFDAFRVGALWRDGDHPLLVFAVTGLHSTVCAEAKPGTDECDD